MTYAEHTKELECCRSRSHCAPVSDRRPQSLGPLLGLDNGKSATRLSSTCGPTCPHDNLMSVAWLGILRCDRGRQWHRHRQTHRQRRFFTPTSALFRPHANGYCCVRAPVARIVANFLLYMKIGIQRAECVKPSMQRGLLLISESLNAANCVKGTLS